MTPKADGTIMAKLSYETNPKRTTVSDPAPLTVIVGGIEMTESAPINLKTAVANFFEKFFERSFSNRHPELGKMIDCPLCGMRHREGDPIAKLSIAHNPAIRTELSRHGRPVLYGPVQKYLSRSAAFKKQRIVQRRNPKIHAFTQLAEKIYEEDIKPFFTPDPEHPDNLIRRAQRRAAHILRKDWIVARGARKHMQFVSRQINRGLLPGGSR